MADDNQTLSKEEAKSLAVSMYQDGAKTDAIYAATGISRPALYMLLRQEGISPNRQRDRRFVPELNAEHLLRRLESAQIENGRLRAKIEILQAELNRVLSDRNGSVQLEGDSATVGDANDVGPVKPLVRGPLTVQTVR